MSDRHTPNQPETVDHVERARKILKGASEAPIEEVHPLALQEAQAHASLAIASELRGIREALTAMHWGAPIDAVRASEEHAQKERE